MSDQTVRVVALACLRKGKLLLLKKSGLDFWILPGGKPEDKETLEETLIREIREELKCFPTNLKYLRCFEDKVAGDQEKKLSLYLYSGDISEDFELSGEIREFCWHPLEINGNHMAPSLTNQIIPFLKKN